MDRWGGTIARYKMNGDQLDATPRTVPMLSGRWGRGVKAKPTKLSPRMVRKIRAYADSITRGTLADKVRDVKWDLLLFDVSEEAIKNVITRDSFASVE